MVATDLVNAKAGAGKTFFYEMLGTFFLVMGICCTVVLGAVANVFVIPLSLYLAIVVGGDVTGGHFNPAVTTAVMIGMEKTCDAGSAIGIYMCA